MRGGGGIEDGNPWSYFIVYHVCMEIGGVTPRGDKAATR